MRIAYAIILMACVILEGCEPKGEKDAGPKNEIYDENRVEKPPSGGSAANNISPETSEETKRELETQLRAAKADVAVKKIALDDAKKKQEQNTQEISIAESELNSAISQVNLAQVALNQARDDLFTKRNALINSVSQIRPVTITVSAAAFKNAVERFDRQATAAVGNLGRIFAAVLSPLWTDTIRNTCREFVNAVEAETSASGNIGMARTHLLDTIKAAAPMHYLLPDGLFVVAEAYRLADNDENRDALIARIEQLSGISRLPGGVFFPIERLKKRLVDAIAASSVAPDIGELRRRVRDWFPSNNADGEVPEAIWTAWENIGGPVAGRVPTDELIDLILSDAEAHPENRGDYELVVGAAENVRNAIDAIQPDAIVNARIALLDGILNMPNCLTWEILVAARSLRDARDDVQDPQRVLLERTLVLPDGNVVKTAATELASTIDSLARLVADSDTKKGRCENVLIGLVPRPDALDDIVGRYNGATGIENNYAGDGLIGFIEESTDPVISARLPAVLVGQYNVAKGNVQTKTDELGQKTRNKEDKESRLGKLRNSTDGLKKAVTTMQSALDSALAKVSDIQKQMNKSSTVV